VCVSVCVCVAVACVASILEELGCLCNLGQSH